MSKENYRVGFNALKRHLAPFKKDILFVSFLGIVSSVFNGITPYILGNFLDELISLSGGVVNYFYNIPLWVFLLSIWFLIQIFENIFTSAIDFKSTRLDYQTLFHITFEGFRKIFRAPIYFHKNQKISQILDKLHMAGFRTAGLVKNAIEIAPVMLSILVGLILAATINLFLTTILVSGIIIYVIVLISLLKKNSSISFDANMFWNESWGDAATASVQINTVKISNTEDYEEEKLRENLFGKVFNMWKEFDYSWIRNRIFQRVIVVFTQLLIFIFSVNFIFKGQMTVGELITLNAYAAMFFGPFVSLGHQWELVQKSLTLLGQSEVLFAQEGENYKPKDSVNFSSIAGEVSFENVFFQYEENEPFVLNNLNFKVKPGQMIALVGESGGGKSTIISLLCGFYFPQKGTVSIDGIDTRNYNLRDLRNQIAIVPQEIDLFNDTIKNNIKYGRFEASDLDVMHAAQKAHIHNHIESLPDKYDTLVGERGIKLSVGQKQRLAIARAILRDPKILILDEPTSALDSENEKNISESLSEIMKDRTTFVIAHRLSTVKKADIILVIEKGAIVEAGNHKELMKISDGVYKKLHDFQINLS